MKTKRIIAFLLPVLLLVGCSSISQQQEQTTNENIALDFTSLEFSIDGGETTTIDFSQMVDALDENGEKIVDLSGYNIDIPLIGQINIDDQSQNIVFYKDNKVTPKSLLFKYNNGQLEKATLYLLCDNQTMSFTFYKNNTVRDKNNNLFQMVMNIDENAMCINGIPFAEMRIAENGDVVIAFTGHLSGDVIVADKNEPKFGTNQDDIVTLKYVLKCNKEGE